MDQADSFIFLGKLEKKIFSAIEMVEALRAENTTLRGERQNLNTKIEELKKTNIELSEQINNLKIKEEHIIVINIDNIIITIQKLEEIA